MKEKLYNCLIKVSCGMALRRGIWTCVVPVFITVFCTISLSACGLGATAGEEKSGVPEGHRVGVASGSAVEVTKADATIHTLAAYPNCSREYVYAGTGNYDGICDSNVAEEIERSAVFQLTPQGKVVAYYPLEDVGKICEVNQVAEGWVYVTIYTGGLQQETTDAGLWRVPIIGQGERERLDWEKRERIVLFDIPEGEEFDAVVYVSENCIVYTTYCDSIYRYDRKTGEVREVQLPSAVSGNIESEAQSACVIRRSYQTVASSDRYQLLSLMVSEEKEDEGVDMDSALRYFALDCEKWSTRELENVYKEYGTDEFIVGEWSGEMLRYGKGCDLEEMPEAGDIYQLNMKEALEKDGGEEILVRAEQIEAVLEETDPWGSNGKKRKWGYQWLSSYQSRLYIELYLTWELQRDELTKEQRKALKDATDDRFDFSGSLVLSLNLENPSDIRYEQGLSTALQTLPEDVPDYHFSSGEELRGECRLAWGPFQMVEGRFFIHLDEHPRTGEKVGCYNINTGESRVLSVKDEDYYLLSYINEVENYLGVWNEQADFDAF